MFTVLIMFLSFVMMIIFFHIRLFFFPCHVLLQLNVKLCLMKTHAQLTRPWDYQCTSGKHFISTSKDSCFPCPLALLSSFPYSLTPFIHLFLHCNSSRLSSLSSSLHTLFWIVVLFGVACIVCICNFPCVSGEINQTINL